jgi:hypothetical protein
MNTDERGLMRIGLSAFIGVDRRLNMFFLIFFQRLLENRSLFRHSP